MTNVILLLSISYMKIWRRKISSIDQSIRDVIDRVLVNGDYKKYYLTDFTDVTSELDKGNVSTSGHDID